MSITALVAKSKIEGAIHWTMDKPAPEYFRHNPFYLVMMRRNHEGLPFLYYPAPKSFSSGYAEGAYQILNKDVRPRVMAKCPLFGEYFVCVDDEAGRANSVIRVLITRGSVVVRSGVDTDKTSYNYKIKRDEVLHWEGNLPYIDATKIVSGKHISYKTPYDPYTTKVVHCRNTKLLGSNYFLIDLTQSVVCVAGHGDKSHVVTPSAKAVLLMSKPNEPERGLSPVLSGSRKQQLADMVAA